MAVSSKFITKTQVKSISLPCRSHPTTLKIEQELNKAKTSAPIAASNLSVDTINSSLSQLAELYKCMDDLLNLPTTRVLISGERNKKWVEELIDESLNFLDVCGSLKEIVSQIKEHFRDLQCALRRRKCEFISYTGFRKKLKKDVKLLSASLKQIDNNYNNIEYMIASGGSVVVDSNNHQLAAVMKAVIGVSETTVSVFESLLSLLSMPNSKANRWSIVVLKLMHKGVVACEDPQEQGIVNEFESVDDALQSLCKNGASNQDEKVQIAKCRLEILETRVEYMEIRLECVFRRLIGTRASLLNIISL